MCCFRLWSFRFPPSPPPSLSPSQPHPISLVSRSLTCQLLVEHAHRELAASSRSPAAVAAAALERAGEGCRDGSVEPPPLAYEEFMEELSQNLPPLSRQILEACEGLASPGGCTHVMHGRSRIYDLRPSHSYKAGMKHVGFRAPWGRRGGGSWW